MGNIKRRKKGKKMDRMVKIEFVDSDFSPHYLVKDFFTGEVYESFAASNYDEMEEKYIFNTM